MREFEVFKVRISTEDRDSWERNFAGQPTLVDVEMALENDHQNAIKDFAPGVTAARFTNLSTVLASGGLPDSHSVVRFAGVKVGEVRVEHATPVLLLEESP